ncbi:hypothetical protein GGI25_003809 [Coemansia spiralis]|uniref:Phytanoyl-CoA dioxygenase family protein n=2 Tax=Coemansia TaxID=4863 RepID=A0A9W8KXT4_9FUNG|nr:hypothetical protein BX070DRAFT_237109 [Coemansia spiralis]KAJ1994637.1 hypothetical protein EDC05_001554 [Coemansia umbellata]KAJ2624442.1 hypothetical protein GGI26_001577 [Coemansia sp. RSA 1358]KAJ2675972.1 hypothetical protein GGI25_003809 [Coemansia spiralis]
MHAQLTKDQIAFFHSNGYLIVPDFLTPEQLAMYKAESEVLANHCYERGDLVANWGCVVEPLGCGFVSDREITYETKTDCAQYINLRSQISPRELTQCTLNRFGSCAGQLMDSEDNVYLLNEQYIVKPPRTKAEFAWHQDVLYFSPKERTHVIVSVWTPLDDVCTDNGTVIVDPFPDPTNPGHYPCTDSPYENSKATFTANMTAGSALFMDGRLRHCSTANRSGKFRSVYMPQFSLGHMTKHGEEDTCTAFAVPIIAK